MGKWIAAAFLAVVLMFSGRAAIDSAGAAPSPSLRQKAATTKAMIDARHYREASRPYYPHYYDRPYYYAPAPFFPLPPFYGYGGEPWR